MPTARLVPVLMAVVVGCSAPDAGPPAPAGPRSQPGTAMGIYTPEQHPLYDGHFRITGGRVHQVGTLADSTPWDHLGDDASNVRPVGGSVLIDVDAIADTGTFRADLDLPEGKYQLTLDRIHAFNPCQDGGIAAYLHEHGNAGCGDGNWPKSLLYVAGWGYGTGVLNGDTLYTGYEVHFMVTQGMRDRTTLRIVRDTDTTPGRAGMVNPAAQQIDFYIRSPEKNPANRPDRQVFDHFFAMEVTWR